MSESIEQRVDALESAVEELLEENRRKDERIDELEAELEKIPPLTIRGDDTDDKIGVALADHLYLKDWNMGESLKKRAYQTDHDQLEERVDDLEEGAVTETVEVDRDEMVPIERDMHDRQRGDHDLRGNRLRATYVYEEFEDHAVSENGLLKLPSSQVKNIHQKHDLDDNRNTIRRTMKMVAKHSANLPNEERDDDHTENLIRLIEGTSKNVLVADKSEWLDHHQLDDSQPNEGDAEEIRNESADEWDALDNAEPVHHSSDDSLVADGGNDTNDDSALHCRNGGSENRRNDA